MKKNLFISIFLSALVIFTSCSSILDESKQNSSEKYGSLSIQTQNRSIDVTSISTAKISITSDDIDDEIYTTCQNITNGAGSVLIERIPVGKNRIITVQAYDISGEPITDGTIRAITDINSGINTLSIINQETS